jgi:DNA-binding CsgD family transcriptional regulator
MDTMGQQPAVSTAATEERAIPVWGRIDHRLHVAVVHTDKAVRHGLAWLLGHDSRLHLMDPVAGLAELQAAGMRFDVCVLGLPETISADELTDLIGRVPCVVWTSARHWRSRVAPWVWGARDVLGEEVGRVPLADTVWDAAHNPYEMHPLLARAILAGVSASGVHASAALLDVLGHVAEGRRVLPALSSAGASVAEYVADVTALRAAFDRAGLGVIPAGEADMPTADDDDDGRNTGRMHAFEPSGIPPEALMLSARVREVLRYYADGYDYEEIGRILSIGETTVKSHVLGAMDKLGITANRTSEVRLLFAMYVSGRHRKPDLVRRRLDNLRTAS